MMENSRVNEPNVVIGETYTTGCIENKSNSTRCCVFSVKNGRMS